VTRCNKLLDSRNEMADWCRITISRSVTLGCCCSCGRSQLLW